MCYKEGLCGQHSSFGEAAFLFIQVVLKMFSLHKSDHPRHCGLFVSLIPGKVLQEKANQNFLSALLCSAQQKSYNKVQEATPLTRGDSK